MCHGAHSRYAEQHIRYGTGCGGTAADIGSSCPVDGSVIPLGTTGTELHYSTATGCPGDPVGLGGDERLMVDGEQQHSLQQLRLNHRSANDHDRLVGEDRCALRHSPDIALKVEVCKIVQKLLAENSSAAQIVDILLIELQILHIVDELLQACKDGKAAIVRDFPEKHIEYRNGILLAALKIAVRHGQLIEVDEHCQVAGCEFFLLHVDPSIPVFRYTDGRSYETASRLCKP